MFQARSPGSSSSACLGRTSLRLGTAEEINLEFSSFVLSVDLRCGDSIAFFFGKRMITIAFWNVHKGMGVEVSPAIVSLAHGLSNDLNLAGQGIKATLSAEEFEVLQAQARASLR